jgi:hypothetical protein
MGCSVRLFETSSRGLPIAGTGVKLAPRKRETPESLWPLWPYRMWMSMRCASHRSPGLQPWGVITQSLVKEACW